LTDDILNASQLAHEIREIYHGLASEDIQVQISINRWIDIHLTLNNPIQVVNFPIRPYHSLLLSSSRANVLKSLPQDCSPTLRAFIDTINTKTQPIKSFEDVFLETNIPFTQLYRMAAHLVYWKKGRIIKKLTSSSVFVPNPEAKLPVQLTQSFAHSFPSFRLPEVLEKFSIPKHLKSHVHGLASVKQDDFINVVVWLLRHNLLLELNTYFYLNIPNNVEPDEDESSSRHCANGLDGYLPPNERTPLSNGTSHHNSLQHVHENGDSHVAPILAPYEKAYLAHINDESEPYRLLTR